MGADYPMTTDSIARAKQQMLADRAACSGLTFDDDGHLVLPPLTPAPPASNLVDLARARQRIHTRRARRVGFSLDK